MNPYFDTYTQQLNKQSLKLFSESVRSPKTITINQVILPIAPCE